MKKEYIKPDFEVVVFEIDDIIATISGGNAGGDLGPDDNIVTPWY